MPLALNGRDLTLEDLERFLGGETVEVSKEAWNRVRAARVAVEKLIATGKPIYGVNTGFGRLANVRIPDDRIRELQENLLRSHAVGVGAPLSAAEARVALLMRTNALVKGHSGVTPKLIEALLALLNAGVAPVVPEQGSVGASGDLAPLAHLALVLIGEGEAWLPDGRRVSGKEALAAAGVAPHVLLAKEGISLINGTQIMSAILALVVLRAKRAAATADVAAAMSVEALKGTKVAFDRRIQAVRPHAGQAASAANLMKLMEGSEIWPSHENCDKVQDQYSLRCAPQVHGAARDAIAYAEGVLAIEMNAATDNPLVFPEDGAILSGGNFHGQPVAQAADFAAIGISELGTISERRIESMVNPDLSGLPAFLSKDGGLNSGMMILQVVAAALVSENKTLCHPACVDSIPTSANKEDHVSMGVTAARKARAVVDNVEKIIAIELVVAAQALDFLRPLKAGPALERVREKIRAQVKPLERDRSMAADIESARVLAASGEIVKAAGLAV